MERTERYRKNKWEKHDTIDPFGSASATEFQQNKIKQTTMLTAVLSQRPTGTQNHWWWASVHDIGFPI